jgi:hypothetical protein
MALTKELDNPETFPSVVIDDLFATLVPQFVRTPSCKPAQSDGLHLSGANSTFQLERVGIKFAW